MALSIHEWMNECLTTPQHEKQIGYWVSEKGLLIQDYDWFAAFVISSFLFSKYHLPFSYVFRLTGRNANSSVANKTEVCKCV